MNPILVEQAVEHGLSIGIFALCVWLVVTIVTKLCGAMDKLVNNMDAFTDRVREEHERSRDQHEKMMGQHEGMIETLGRINGFRKQ
jgi:hypothetical protein